jgi:putative hydrolase of the HAD superfamily
MAIHAILFDFVGVLFFKNPKLTVDTRIKEIDKQIGSVTNDAEFITKIQQQYHFQEKEFEKIIMQIASMYEPFIPLWDLLPNLKKTYLLAVINNGTTLTLQHFFQTLPIQTLFNVFVSSAQEGIKKPDPEIFIRTTNKLSVNPEECLFMDDSFENIQAANHLGMKTIWWNKDRYTHLQEFSAMLEL